MSCYPLPEGRHLNKTDTLLKRGKVYGVVAQDLTFFFVVCLREKEKLPFFDKIPGADDILLSYISTSLIKRVQEDI